MPVQQNVRFTLFQYLLNIKDYKCMTSQVTFKCLAFTFLYVECFLDFKDRHFENTFKIWKSRGKCSNEIVLEGEHLHH